MNFSKKTPFHIAALNGNIELLKLLIDQKADPFIKNSDFKLPIDFAQGECHRLLQDYMGHYYSSKISYEPETEDQDSEDKEKYTNGYILMIGKEYESFVSILE